MPARALVAIRAASNGRFIAAVRTDSQGRYRLTGHPRGKIILSASRPGYYTKLAAGRQGSEVPLDCSAGCSFSEVDFELGRGSVIGGVVVDEFGEAVERAGVFVEAWKPRFQKKIDTDDRGGFRVAGLRPATYLVRARFGGRRGATQSNPVRIRLGEGAERTDLELRLGRQNFDGQLRSTARAGRRGSGRNRTANRPPGARVNGSVKLEGGASPSQFRLVFRDRTSSKHWVQVRRPGYHFTLDRMKPGSYRIDTSSQDVYIKGVLQDDKVVPVKDVTISQGGQPARHRRRSGFRARFRDNTSARSRRAVATGPGCLGRKEGDPLGPGGPERPLFFFQGRSGRISHLRLDGPRPRCGLAAEKLEGRRMRKQDHSGGTRQRSPD